MGKSPEGFPASGLANRAGARSLPSEASPRSRRPVPPPSPLLGLGDQIIDREDRRGTSLVRAKKGCRPAQGWILDVCVGQPAFTLVQPLDPLVGCSFLNSGRK